MSEKRAKTARQETANGDSPSPQALEGVREAVEIPSGGQQTQTITHPSVLVMRIPGDQPGQERIEMAELNGIDPLSVPTLLRMAANIKQNQLGIGG